MAKDAKLPLKPTGGDPGTPRAMLPKGSPEWCYRTVDRLRWALDKVNISEAEFEKTLAELESHRAWEVIPSREKPYGTLDALLKAELGLTRDEATAQKQRTMLAARNTNGQVLPQGGDQKSEERKSKTDSAVDTQSERARKNRIGRDAQRKLDHLARNRPDLHEQVKSGALSVDAAYRQAKNLPRKVPVPIEVDAAARVLRRHFAADDLRRLAAKLLEP